jgi:hypothetical protein
VNRSTTRILIAVALAVYGLYIARYVPALLIGPIEPALLIGFVLQVVCALVAALGVWRGDRWAAAAVIVLGAIIAGTWLYEGFVLGIVAYLRTLLAALIAVVVTLGIAIYINPGSSTSRAGR